MYMYPFQDLAYIQIYIYIYIYILYYSFLTTRFVKICTTGTPFLCFVEACARALSAKTLSFGISISVYYIILLYCVYYYIIISICV